MKMTRAAPAITSYEDMIGIVEKLGPLSSIQKYCLHNTPVHHVLYDLNDLRVTKVDFTQFTQSQ